MLTLDHFALEVILGAVVVFLLTIRRFGIPPLQWADRPASRHIIGRALYERFVQSKHTESPDPEIFPPVSSNTTRWKFLLSGTSYGVMGMVIFSIFLAFPTLTENIPRLLEAFGMPTKMANLLRVPSLLLQAFLIGYVLPSFYPFKRLDEEVRHQLYEWALIPAELRNLAHRIKIKPFGVTAESLSMVTERLKSEGFRPGDIAYESSPTPRSLWTKASVLFYLIEEMEAQPQGRSTEVGSSSTTRLKKAFAALKDSTGKRSVDLLSTRYETLRNQAKDWFEIAQEEVPLGETDRTGTLVGREEESRKREQFREDCKRLLEDIYHFLARFSLFSYRSDHTRVTQLNKLGFHLKEEIGGPAPTLDEVIVFIGMLTILTIPPLRLIIGHWRGPLMINVIFFLVALTPIAIAKWRLEFAIQHEPGRYLAFPLVSGVIATLCGSAISLIVIGPQPFFKIAWTWMLLVFITSFVLAIQMRRGAYPENLDDLKGLSRLPAYGSIKDGAVLWLVVALATFGVVYFQGQYPQQLFVDEDIEVPALTLAIPTMSLFGILFGFFVPTWFRANTARRLAKENEEKRTLAATPSPDS